MLHPASLDDITKVWSAVSGTNFRRSVVYEVTVIQIETPAPRVQPQPVTTRRIFMTVRKRPEIVDAYVSPVAPGDPIGERRVRIGEEITIVSQAALADQLYVRLGSLEPIRVSAPGDGWVRIAVPDDQYPIDLDHTSQRPIPPAQQLQAGPLEVQLIAVHPVEGVQGRLGGEPPSTARGVTRRTSGFCNSCPHHGAGCSDFRKRRDDPAHRWQPSLASCRAHRRGHCRRCGDPGTAAGCG